MPVDLLPFKSSLRALLAAGWQHAGADFCGCGLAESHRGLDE